MFGEAIRVGDWVEVLPIQDILRTLDGEGTLDAMPFMPEMARYAGRRFRVMKSAHKTCDPTGASELRRLRDAVHLETRCDGGAHDGCEARCLIIWKTAWLQRVDGPHGEAVAQDLAQDPGQAAAYLPKLQTLTRRADQNGKPRYRCQVTEIAPATTEIPAWDLRHFVEDVSAGNISPRDLLTEVGALARTALTKGASKLQAACGMADAAWQAAAPPELERLDLQPGERVRVKSAAEILATLDQDNKHRGLAVETEMLRHCGKTYRVAARIQRMIDEKTGRMIRFATPCVALEGVSCNGLDNRRRIFCPRSPLYFWREGWLERVEENADQRPPEPMPTAGEAPAPSRLPADLAALDPAIAIIHAPASASGRTAAAPRHWPEPPRSPATPA